MKFVPRWQAITDEQLQDRYSHAEIAREALLGGAEAIQFREKRSLATRELVELASGMVAECQKRNGVAIINDRADVAFAVGAQMLHLGKNDLDPMVARRILGKRAVIGRTANSLVEAMSASVMDIDYLGVGPVFQTGSKKDPAPALGIAGLSEICKRVSLPVVAIGGIRPENVEEILSAGAWGFAVLAGIVCSQDIRQAAKGYADALAEWRKNHL